MSGSPSIPQSGDFQKPAIYKEFGGIPPNRVVIVGRPVARHLQDGQTAEVTRLCVPDGAPRNVCSFLYARAVRAARELGWKRLVTYTLESEAGASLRAAGWKPVAEVAPQATWARPARDRDDATHRTVSRRVRWEIAL